MDQKTLADIRRRLEKLAARLQGEARGIMDEALTPKTGVRGGELSGVPFHLADGGTEEFLAMMNAALLENELQLAAAVRDALGRIDRGDYGLCVTCGEAISKERLLALPFAQSCIRCAELAEINGAVSSPNLNRGRPTGPADTLAPEGEMAEGRRDQDLDRQTTRRRRAHDEHAAGTPGGGAASGGLAGTNVGRGEPLLGDLAEASGSGEHDRNPDR